PFLRLSLAQGRFDRSFEGTQTRAVDIRLVADPNCTFGAWLTHGLDDSIARDGTVLAEARPVTSLPPCAQEIRNGAAVVGRIPLPDKSLFDHLKTLALRLLQNRLPIGTEGQT
ncbi:MAG: hypothetical protein AAGO57_07835, partial [Pseudomonadota bacterium]